MSSDLLLVHFDPDKKIVLTCDASPYRVGTVLSHLMSDGTERPISFVSKTLSQAEHNYAHIENKAVPTIASAHIQHWALILSLYSYTVSYKPGSEIPHAAHDPVLSAVVRFTLQG